MNKTTFLCVANWDSDVGYAWWLMESFWAEIARHYHTEYQVTIAYPSISKIPKVIEESRLKIEKMDFVTQHFGSIFSQLKFIISNRVRYLYFSDRPISYWRYPLYRLAGVRRIIVHDHTPGTRSKAGFIKHTLKLLRTRIPFYSADGVVGATDYVKKRLAEINGFPSDKCFAAPNGVRPVTSTHGSNANPYKLFSIPEDRKIIVSVGRANFYKGVDFALDTVKVLIKEFQASNIHFLYLGDGPDLEEFKRLAIEYGIETHVSFPGRVDNVSEILKFCYIAFHPSRGEVGYSLSILEYMQAALATVVSDNPSVCEATEDGVTGRIYQEGNVANAAESINSLLSNEALTQSMGNNALVKTQTDYSMESCHRALILALDTILEIKKAD